MAHGDAGSADHQPCAQEDARLGRAAEGREHSGGGWSAPLPALLETTRYGRARETPPAGSDVVGRGRVVTRGLPSSPRNLHVQWRPGFCPLRLSSLVIK